MSEKKGGRSKSRTAIFHPRPTIPARPQRRRSLRERTKPSLSGRGGWGGGGGTAKETRRQSIEKAGGGEEKDGGRACVLRVWKGVEETTGRRAQGGRGGATAPRPTPLHPGARRSRNAASQRGPLLVLCVCVCRLSHTATLAASSLSSSSSAAAAAPTTTTAPAAAAQKRS